MSDSRELAHASEGGGAVDTGSSGPRAVGIPMEQRMAMLREALTNPDVDPQKAVAMAELMFKLEDRDRQAEFNRDLIAAKREIGPIFKRGKNEHLGTRYGKFEDIQRVTDPILDRHNLSLDYKIGSDGKDITVRPVLRHANGWVEVGDAIKGPPDTGPGRSAIQSVGSSSSYLQRYAAKAALNLRFDGEDDDGVGGRPGDQPNDRQQRLILDAQEAAEAGNYAAWYGRLGTKDKAWLVTTGHHATLGGGAALPGPTPTEPRREPEPEPEPRPEATGGGDGRPRKTPEQQVEAYEAGVAGCKSRDALLEYQQEPKRARWIAQMKADHPELHKRIVRANEKQLQELNGNGGQPGEGGLFEGSE